MENKNEIKTKWNWGAFMVWFGSVAKFENQTRPF